MEEIFYYCPLAISLASLALVLSRRSLPEGSGRWHFADYSDVIWCGASLLTKPYILYSTIGGTHSSRLPWFDLSIVAGFLALGLLLPRRFRVWAEVLVVTLLSIWIWGDLIHYRFFGDVATLATLLAAGNGPELAESAMGFSQTRRLAALYRPGTCGRSRRHPEQDDETPGRRAPDLDNAQRLQLWRCCWRSPRRGIVQVGILLTSPLGSTRSKVFQSSNLVREYGLVGFHFADTRQRLEHLWRSNLIPAEDLEEVSNWFVESAPSRAGDRPPRRVR